MSTTNDVFKIELPEGWEDRSVFLFQGPEDQGMQHNLTLTIDKTIGEQELVDFAQERLEMLVGSMQGIEVLKEEEKTLPNGIPVYEAVYKWIPTDEKIIFQKLVYMVNDGIGYTFSASFTKQTIKTIGEEINQIIESFQPVSS